VLTYDDLGQLAVSLAVVVNLHVGHEVPTGGQLRVVDQSQAEQVERTKGGLLIGRRVRRWSRHPSDYIGARSWSLETTGPATRRAS
jgi:hypothetical protein